MDKINNRDLLYKKTIVSPIDVIGVLDDDFESNPLLVIHKIVAKYIKKISGGSISKRIVDGFYTVLCYEYNLTAGSPEAIQPDFDQTLFNVITKYIYENYDNEGKELVPILYEIIVLHLKLYFSVSTIGDFVKNFLATAKNHNNANNDIIHRKIIECFVDALCLKHAPDQQEMTEAGLPILEEMISWYKDMPTKDWLLFVGIMTKMVKLFEKRISLDYLWVMILNYSDNDWEKSLALLNVTIDDVLALSSEEKVSVNHNCCRSDTLWQLILQGLMSPVEQNHKLGLHSMKRVLNFLEKYQPLSNQVSNIIPFICCPNYRSDLAVKHAINYFFLLMESLEGQGSLVRQTVCQLEILVRFHNFHCLFCLNCLDFIWLECVFKRVLTHPTPEVIKAGVIALLKLDPRFYYDDLLVLLINTLNNVTIHDSETFSLEPQIIKELSELLVQAEYAQVSLIKKFICHASQVTWEPIPLFYMLYCLSKAGYMVNFPVQCNKFEENELKCLQMIIEKNASNQLSVSMNAFCQNIINIINLYVPISDQTVIESLSKIYAELEASCLCHKLIINSLRNNVTTEKAAQYIYAQCERLSKLLVKRNAQDIVGLNQFATMTVYLFDASLIFRASNVSELKAMCSVFNTIIVDESQQKYVDKIHHTKILELLNYFFTELNKVCAIDKLNFIINSFMAVLESVLVSVVNTFEQPIIYTYKELEIYTQTFQTISELIISKVEDYRGYFTKVLAETERVIESVSNDEFKDIKYLFAMKLHYTCIKYLEKYNTSSLKLMINAIKRPLKFKESNGMELKMASECYDLIARSIVQVIKFVPNNSSLKIAEPVKSVQRLLTLEKERVMPSAIELMTKSLYLTCIDNYGNIIEPFFELAWKNLWTMEQNEMYFKCYDMFADFSFLIAGFKIVDNFRHEGVKYINEMYEKGKNVPRLRRSIITKLTSINEDSIALFQSIILKILIHVEEEDTMTQRLEAQVQFFAFNNSDPEIRNLTAVDMTNRARLVLKFCAMLKHGKGVGTKDMVGALISELEERKHILNLNSDRVKCRVMQVLMVLQPYLNQDRASQIISVISESIISEKVSLIVRTLQEWLLIKLFLMYVKLIDDLWKLFESVRHNAESITSVALIIYHVAVNAMPKSQGFSFIRNAIQKLEFFLHNKEFHGHYCQVVIVRLIRLLPPNSTNYLMELKKTIENNLMSSEFSAQLAQDFRLNKFHPHKNYTIKTIFYDLPRLMNSCKSEWILPAILDYENTAMLVNSSGIKISNVCTLENAQTIQTAQTKTQQSDGKIVNNSDNDVEIVELE